MLIIKWTIYLATDFEALPLLSHTCICAKGTIVQYFVPFSFSIIYPPSMEDLHPFLGLTIQMLVGQMPIGRAQTVDQSTRQIHKVGPPWICGQQNARSTTRNNKGQNTRNPQPVPG